MLDQFYLNIGLTRRPNGANSEAYEAAGIEHADPRSRALRGVPGNRACPVILKGCAKRVPWWETGSYRRLWESRYRSLREGKSRKYPGPPRTPSELKRASAFLYFDSLDNVVVRVYANKDWRTKFINLLEWRYQYEKRAGKGQLRPGECIDAEYAFAKCMDLYADLARSSIPKREGGIYLSESGINKRATELQVWLEKLDGLDTDRDMFELTLRVMKNGQSASEA